VSIRSSWSACATKKFNVRIAVQEDREKLKIASADNSFTIMFSILSVTADNSDKFTDIDTEETPTLEISGLFMII